MIRPVMTFDLDEAFSGIILDALARTVAERVLERMEKTNAAE